MITALTMTDVHKRYHLGPHVLRGVSVTLPRGSFIALIGPAGSGKSTFLRCAAGLDRPTSGSVMLGDTDLGRMRKSRLTKLRLTRLGFVFETPDLLPALTVAQNVLLPIRLTRRLPLSPAGTKADQDRAMAMLDRAGIAATAHNRPGELSGGRQQQVAIARALITDPEVIFADEPTGALDDASTDDVLGLLRTATETTHTTVLVVTHDRAVAGWADQVLTLADGHLTANRLPPTPAPPRPRPTHRHRPGRHPASPRSPALVTCPPYY